MPLPVTVDFETTAIEPRPQYPPTPVGVALWVPGEKPVYLAWGHPTGNTTTRAEAVTRLRRLWESGVPLLFHNAKFDLEVAERHLGLRLPSWERVHDTLFLLFLHEPHATSLSLKPSAERLLHLPPEEQEAVRQWLVAHRIVTSTDRGWGAKIACAPGGLVGEYAIGDVVRTRKLFDHLLPLVKKNGMLKAYDRERRLLPLLLASEQRGIRVDPVMLREAVEIYTAAKETADAYLRKTLRVKGLNVDSDIEVADALQKRHIVTDWTLTPTGRRSVSKKHLTPDRFTSARVASALGYRQRLATCVSTFLAPWAAMSAETGRISATWHQVRQGYGAHDTFAGARTGRLASTPNLQNIPTDFDTKDDGYRHPTFLSVPMLPHLRDYLLPEEGEEWIQADYNQQELRILAHFEDGDLLRAYQTDPFLDLHTYIQREIETVVEHALERKTVKVLNFGLIYGMGIQKLSETLRISADEARALRAAHRRAITGLGELEMVTRNVGRTGEPIRTWGGRLYYTEPPKAVGTEVRTFEYKLLNYLIQGSAADCTKEAIVRYGKPICAAVHDELNISGGAQDVKELREAMESVEFDVAMTTTVKQGASWGACQ